MYDFTNKLVCALPLHVYTSVLHKQKVDEGTYANNSISQAVQ